MITLLIGNTCFAGEESSSLYSKTFGEIIDSLSPAVRMAQSEQERIDMLGLTKSIEDNFDLPAYFAIVSDSLKLKFNIVPRAILEQCLLTLRFLPDIELIRKKNNTKCQEELLETVESLISCIENILRKESNYLMGQELADKAVQHPAFFMRQVECISRLITRAGGIFLAPCSNTPEAPPYAFVGCTDTGIYSSGANDVCISTAGAAALKFDSTGNITIDKSTSARTLALARNTTANTAGQGLTVNTGGATSGSTDKNGGDLTLTSGIATGTGSSNVIIQTSKAGSTGTADRAVATVLTINGEGQLLAGNGTVTLPTFSFSSDANTGIYSAGADTIGISTGGVQRASFGATTTIDATIELNDGVNNSTSINTGSGSGNVGILSGTGTGTLDLGNTASGAVTLNSGSTITIGDASAGAISITSNAAVDIDGAGIVSINSSGAAINIGNDAVAQAINIGTGAAARTVAIGNATGATEVDITAGTGGIKLTGGVIDVGTQDINSANTATSLNTLVTTLTADVSNYTSSLADGTVGQLKVIAMRSTGGGNFTITPTNFLGWTNITLDAAGESVTLVFATGGWIVVGVSGATLA